MQTAMHTIVSGHISFGLVTIPMKLYAATKDLTPRFQMVYRDCGTRIEYMRRCSTCQREVSLEEIDRAHAVAKGEYVIFSKEELAILSGETVSGTIELVEVVDPREIDLAYVEKSYWLAPDNRDARAFELLRDVLLQKQRVGLARVKLRSRVRLAMLRPRSRFLSLDIMRFGDEIVSDAGLVMPESKPVTERERELALSLVGQLETSFDPTKHPDKYRTAFDSVVERKVAEGAVRRAGETTPATPAIAAQLYDLTELLSRSLTTTSEAANAPPPKPGLSKAAPKRTRKAKSKERSL
jgi:DNA end-binding protein Ku